MSDENINQRRRALLTGGPTAFVEEVVTQFLSAATAPKNAANHVQDRLKSEPLANKPPVAAFVPAPSQKRQPV